MNIAGVISYSPTAFGPIVHQGNFEEGIQFLSRLGYEGVEISIRDPKEIDAQKLSQVLKKNNLILTGIATDQAALKDGLNFTNKSESVRKAAIKRIQTQVDLAAEYSAPVLVGLIRGHLPKGEEKEII